VSTRAAETGNNLNAYVGKLENHPGQTSS